jgi:hypothetical protein
MGLYRLFLIAIFQESDFISTAKKMLRKFAGKFKGKLGCFIDDTLILMAGNNPIVEVYKSIQYIMNF